VAGQGGKLAIAFMAKRSRAAAGADDSVVAVAIVRCSVELPIGCVAMQSLAWAPADDSCVAIGMARGEGLWMTKAIVPALQPIST
jgi:hypothetical protein